MNDPEPTKTCQRGHLLVFPHVRIKKGKFICLRCRKQLYEEQRKKKYGPVKGVSPWKSRNHLYMKKYGKEGYVNQ